MAWGYAELLRDEARHATFGANAAAWIIRRWPAHLRRSLWAQCLAESARWPSARATAEAEALGLLPAPTGCTLPRWILPHLQPLGLTAAPGQRAGRSRQRDPVHSLKPHDRASATDGALVQKTPSPACGRGPG